MLSRPWLWKRPQAGEDTPDFWSATGLSHAMKREMRLCAAALLFATVLPSFCVAEYAERLVPMFPGKTVGGRVKWAHVVWDDEFPNAATADMRAANLTDERIADGLGEWANFQLPGDTAFSLTCKVDPQQDSLVCLVSTSAETRATVYGGCCADSILIKGKDNPSNDNIFHIVEDIRAAMLADGYAAEDVGTAYPSHTISVQREDQGALSVVVNVQVRPQPLGCREILRSCLNGSVWAPPVCSAVQ